MPTATIVRITKMMGLACSEVQCGVSASTAGGGSVDRLLIFPQTSPSLPASHRRLPPSSRLASRRALLFHPADRRRRQSPPDLQVKRRSEFGPCRARECQHALSSHAPP